MSGAEENEVCRAFRNNGRCRFGESCKFEHSEGAPIAPPENRPPPGECYTWRDEGSCTHGDRCRFTHGPDDTRQTGNIADEICRNYQAGKCRLGEDCRRKHEGPVREAAEGGGRRRNRGRAGICYTFRDEGACEREECKFSHNLEEDVGGEDAAPRGNRRRTRGRGICYAFRDDGFCDVGEECKFSHTAEEEQEARPARQPRFCYDFREGNCERGEDCRFSHEAGDTSAPPARAPRKVKKLDEICNNFKAGKCRLGERCRRIHEGGEVEAAAPAADTAAPAGEGY